MITSSDRTTSAGHVDLPSQPDAPAEEPKELLSADLSADQLFLQLGYAYFTLQAPTREEASSTVRTDSSCAKLEPRALADMQPQASWERDFWEEVAATSEKLAALPTASTALPSDPIAFAIATVSASYTIAATDKRLTTLAHQGPSPAIARQSAPQTKDSRSTEQAETKSHPESDDIVDLMMSLLDLESILDLGDAASATSEVFAQARALAVDALLAAEVNRDSALKAAEGKKG